MDEKKGFFEDLGASAGRQMDAGMDKLASGLGKILGTSSSNEKKEMSISDYFSSRIKAGKIECKQVDATFSYRDILLWAKDNHTKGNRLYLVRIKFDEKIVVCVFFAENETLLLKKDDPKICYLCTSLPIDVSDLFGTTDVYIQKLAENN